MRANRWISGLTGVLIAVFGATGLHAQTATQVVRFSVVPSSRVAVSGVSANIGRTSYAVSTNELNQKITASLDRPLPAGVTLAVSLRAPEGAASTGTKLLGSAAADVVTGISAINASELPIVYTVRTSAPAAVDPGTRIVTFTVIAGQ